MDINLTSQKAGGPELTPPHHMNMSKRWGDARLGKSGI